MINASFASAPLLQKSILPLHVAETLVRTFDDTAGLSDIDEYLNEFDSTMKSALVSHFDLFDDEDDEDNDWD